MSETPRTDAVTLAGIVGVEFARILERELTALSAECDALRKKHETERAANQNSASAMALALKTREMVEHLREILWHAERAINPPDKGGISMHEWNTRLKSTSAAIHAGIDAADAFLGIREHAK